MTSKSKRIEPAPQANEPTDDNLRELEVREPEPILPTPTRWSNARTDGYYRGTISVSARHHHASRVQINNIVFF